MSFYWMSWCFLITLHIVLDDTLKYIKEPVMAFKSYTTVWHHLIEVLRHLLVFFCTLSAHLTIIEWGAQTSPCLLLHVVCTPDHHRVRRLDIFLSSSARCLHTWSSSSEALRHLLVFFCTLSAHLTIIEWGAQISPCLLLHVVCTPDHHRVRRYKSLQLFHYTTSYKHPTEASIILWLMRK